MFFYQITLLNLWKKSALANNYKSDPPKNKEKKFHEKVYFSYKETLNRLIKRKSVVGEFQFFVKS